MAYAEDQTINRGRTLTTTEDKLINEEGKLFAHGV